MHTQLTIFKKGLTLIAIPLLVQVVFIAVLMKARVDRDRAQYWAIHTKEVIAKVEETHRNLIEANLQVRDLVLSARPATTDMYRQTMGQVPRQLEELRALVLDNERQRSQIQQLGDRSREFLGWIRVEEDLIRAGRRDRALERIDRGTDLLKGIRSTIDDVLREEERLDRDRMETLRASSTQQAWTLIGGGAAIVISTLILALLFLQGIVQRLAVLRDNARRFGEGRPLNEPLSGRD